MLLTTGAIALGRKISDEKAKRKEKKQGQLSVGSSDVAKRAFASQTSKMIEEGPARISRTGTDIKFEDPDQVNVKSQEPQSAGVYSPDVEFHDARSTSQVNITSPVQSEKAAFGTASPYTETPTSAVAWRSETNTFQSSTGTSVEPPPYSAGPKSPATTMTRSVYSKDTDGVTLAASDTRSIASGSTNSRGTHAIRVKTKGGDLKSGFPYHPALFDYRIHPDQWENFTCQIIDSTKFDTRDNLRMVGAATATALTGAIGTSVWVGRSMNRKIQEEKVRQGLQDDAKGGLSDTLKLWNEEYFSKLGLFVHLDLSDSALKNPDQKSKTFRKPALFYNNREDRERKNDERKFVLVVTKLDEEGRPIEAIQELGGTDGGPVEIGSSGDVSSSITEMPADEGNVYVELPAELPASAAEKKLDPPVGYVEMDGDNSYALEKMHLVEADPDAEKALPPKPLNIDSPLDKETT